MNRVLCIFAKSKGTKLSFFFFTLNKVFQRRADGVTDFYRNWTSYKYGFGTFDGDFWLGNEQLHYLTIQKNYKLRIEFLTSGGTLKYASYESFRVSSYDNKYRIENIGSYSGTGGLYNSNISHRCLNPSVLVDLIILRREKLVSFPNQRQIFIP